MGFIKRFFKDEAGSSEAVSSVILIAFATILLSGALGVYYGAFTGFFDNMKAFIDAITAWIVPPTLP